MKKANFGDARTQYYPYSSNPLMLSKEGQPVKLRVIGLLGLDLPSITEAEPYEKYDLLKWNH